MYVYLACMSVCAPCVFSVLRSQKTGLALLELELQMGVSLHVGAANQTRVPWKGSQR